MIQSWISGEKKNEKNDRSHNANHTLNHNVSSSVSNHHFLGDIVANTPIVTSEQMNLQTIATLAAIALAVGTTG
jgi:hypothetical protein